MTSIQMPVHLVNGIDLMPNYKKLVRISWIANSCNQQKIKNFWVS